jgi:hypothetical protein
VAIAVVIVPRITASVHAGDKAALAAAQSRADRRRSGVARCCRFRTLAKQIASGLFEHSESAPRTRWRLRALCRRSVLGYPARAEKVFGGSPHEDTHTPMFAALIGATAMVGVFAVPATRQPPPAYPAGGTCAQFHFGPARLARLDADARRRLPRIALATIVMAASSLCDSCPRFGRARVTVVARRPCRPGDGRHQVYLATLQLLGVMKLKGWP